MSPTYSQPSAVMKNPFGRCTVQYATAIVPTTADAARGVAVPLARAAPAPISTAALS
jgi:hypothetical protein